MFPAGDPRFRVRQVELATGMRLRVLECGDERAPYVAVCVHGWACSVYSYRFLMPLLAERGMRVVAMDLPGHGLSDKPSDIEVYSLDALAGVVLDTLDALGVERALVVGHSMGGTICARVAVLAPARVQGLVLLAPAGFGSEWAARLGAALTPRVVAPALPHLLSRGLVGAVLHFSYGRLYRPTPRDVDEYWAPSQFPGFARAIWDLLHHFEWTAGADQGFDTVSAPAVVMNGDMDHYVMRRWARCYADAMRHATFTQIPGCGHVIPEEAPLMVRDAVMGVMH
jgi:pimeloyl-ACP methyl ester carboxylesterase